MVDADEGLLGQQSQGVSSKSSDTALLRLLRLEHMGGGISAVSSVLGLLTRVDLWASLSLLVLLLGL